MFAGVRTPIRLQAFTGGASQAASCSRPSGKPSYQGNLSRGGQGSSRLVAALYCSYAGCPPYRSAYPRSRGGMPGEGRGG